MVISEVFVIETIFLTLSEAENVGGSTLYIVRVVT